MDIADWWNRTTDDDGRLVLSSRRLLVILKNLPDDSPFKNAFRDDWCDSKYVQAAIVNELRGLRSDNAALNGQELSAVMIKSPRQKREDDLDSEEKQKIRTGIMAQLHREN